MTSISDKSLLKERRRRPAPRRAQTPWSLYAVLWLAVAGLAAYARSTGAVWPLVVISAAVVVLVAWLLWGLWRERRR